jgi:hypothetical protein
MVGDHSEPEWVLNSVTYVLTRKKEGKKTERRRQEADR